MAKRLFGIVLGIGIIVIALACWFRFGPLYASTPVKIDTSSMLTEAIDIAELSTAEFKYRGIADVFADEQETRILCRVCYSATVKAGIDLKNVQFEINESEKTVTATLPEISLKVSIIDEQSMALLPSDADVGIDSLLKYSKADAEREASESEELMTTAKDNLKATIEGLIYPVLKSQGFLLIWK